MPNVDSLIVGSGGGGGTSGNTTIGGGGGGGGDVIVLTAVALAVGSYAIVVGTGGGVHIQGSSSSFNGSTAAGGGRGGGAGNGEAGGSGGSGGGGEAAAGGSGVGTNVHSGGTGSSSGVSSDAGGGGGGAGTAGGNSTPDGAGGNGGTGFSSSITGAAVTYGGGGGGGDGGFGTGGTGNGGGGNGAHGATAATAGAANRGGGGGGGQTGVAAAAGGSGVVIIRYLTSDFASYTITGGTPATDGTSTVRTFTATGTLVVSLILPSNQLSWPNPPSGPKPSPQRFSIEGGRNQALFFVPPPPLPYGQSLLSPNPVRLRSYETWRWGVEHATPIGLYASYLPLPTDVIFYINGSDFSAYVNKDSVEINDNINEEPNTCSFKINGAQPSVGQNIQIGLGALDPTRLIFSGTITSVKQVYDGSPVIGTNNIAWRCDCIDYTFLLNRRRPTGTFTAVSATTVFTSLVTNFSSGFTYVGVPSGLPTVTISFDGSSTFAQCLTDLCNLIQYKWKMSYSRDLKVFVTAPGTAPLTIDVNNVTTQADPMLEYDLDISQIRTRVTGKGPAKNLMSDVLVGESILPISDSTGFSSVGGTAYLGPTPITYGGTQHSTTSGSFVGVGTGPSTGPTATPASGTGLTAASVYIYSYTFVTPLGESLPSPLGTVTTTSLAAPVSTPTIGGTGAGGSMDLGTHDYEYTYVTSAGETTPSPVSSAFTSLVLADPGALTPNSVVDTGAWTFGGQPPGTVIDVAFFYAGNGSAKSTVSGYISHTVIALGGGQALISVDVPGVADPNVTIIWIAARWPSGSGSGQWWNQGSAVTNPGLGNHAATNIAPGNLTGFLAPTVNVPQKTCVIQTIDIGSSNVTGRKLYRRFNGVGTFKLVTTIADNVTTSYTDSLANASLGAAAPSTNTAFQCQVALSGIAIGPSPTSSRNVYRSIGGGTQPKFVVTVVNNTATTLTDSLPDGSLGANAPTGDTSGLSIPTTNGAGFYTSASVVFPTNGAATTANTTTPFFTSASYTFVAADIGATIYIQSGTNWISGRYLILNVIAGSAVLPGPCATVASPTNATWGIDYSGLAAARYVFSDMVIDGTTSTKFTSAAFPVGVNYIGNVVAVAGSIGFIAQRVIILSLSGVIATCDKSIGVVSSTNGAGNLGGAAVNTFIAAGSATLLVASVGPFFSIGGWAAYGSNYIRYTGILGSSLTGIPTSGVGSITTSIAYGATLTSIDALTGCTGIIATVKGTNIYLAVQLNDTASQAILAALEGGDGVHEYVFTDSSVINLAALTAEAQSVLDTFKDVLVSVVESARDINTTAGKDLTISLPSPMLITVVVTIQSVRITHVGTEHGQYPLYTATASSVKYTLQDLIRQLGSLISNS